MAKGEGNSTKGQKVNCQLPGADSVAEGRTVDEALDLLIAIDDLSAQHDLFCREYIIDDNQTRAYMRVYTDSSYGAAAVSAHQLLKNPKIIARIGTLREERYKRLEISADKVLRRLEARAAVTPRDFYKPDGSFIPVHELHPDVAIGIKSIEVAELYDGQGPDKQAIGLVRKITMVDGKASDELLGRNLSLWKEVGSKDNPLTGEVTQKHDLSDDMLSAIASGKNG